MEEDEAREHGAGQAEEEQEEDAPPRPARRRRGAGDAEDGGPAAELHDLLRVLARQRVVLAAAERPRAQTNAALVASLWESNMLTSASVKAAMLAVPRGSFVPVEYRDEAYIDAPIRVEAEDFNISAPHMHASMLEAMRLKPGDRFLDVGCGCGILAACAAMLVGPSGSVAGVDTRGYCVELSEDNVARLRASSSEYASKACEVQFERHNIFLPSARWRGTYNKVCVGAACPEDRVHLLLKLLADEPGSLLLVPVETDLRLYERRRDGSARPTTVSSVRFSDLEVPSDATVALAAMEDARAARLRVDVSPSTFGRDVGHIMPPAGRGAACPAGDASGSGSGSDGGGGAGQRLNNKAAACRNGEEGEDGSDDVSRPSGSGARGGPAASAGGQPGERAASPAPLGFDAAMAGACAALGPPDYRLEGPGGWSVAAHRDVLKARCPIFRARLTSGMRDADGASHAVPDSFSQRAVEALVWYLYTDALPPGLEDPPQVEELLHAAVYYGCTRLTELCEARLVDALLQLEPAQAAAEAPSLLRLGGELGLRQLQRAAAGYIASHYGDASKGEGYAALTRAEVDLVAAELARAVDEVREALQRLVPPEGVRPQQSRRILWW